MGRLVLIAVIVIASIITITMVSVHERSQELPETLNMNFKNLGSYALQYAVNQLVEGEVTEPTVQEFTGDDEFRVLNGKINQIEYLFTYQDVTVGDGDDDGEGDGGLALEGSLNINPSNGSNEFQLTTPSGAIYDRWDLHSYNLYGYDGPASEIQIKPKAQGIYLTINDEVIALRKNTLYTISSESMNGHIYNTKIKHGRAMGKWWIDIEATNARIDPLPDGVEYEEEEDAQQEVFTLIQNVEIIADVESYVAGHTYEHTSSAYLEADTKVDFDIEEDGTVIVNDNVNVTFTCLGVAFANTNNRVKMEYSLDGGKAYTELWSNNYIQSDWEYEVEDIESGTEIVLKATWYYGGNRYQTSINSWTEVYRDGDQAPEYTPYPGQDDAEEFMAPYLTSTGEVTLGENDAIFLFELGHVTQDYQDAVMLITFEKKSKENIVYVEDIDLETDSYKVIYWKP